MPITCQFKFSKTFDRPILIVVTVFCLKIKILGGSKGLFYAILIICQTNLLHHFISWHIILLRLFVVGLSMVRPAILASAHTILLALHEGKLAPQARIFLTVLPTLVAPSNRSEKL